MTNTSCSIIFQLHMIPDYVSLAYRVTYWHHPLASKYTGSTIFTVCIVYTSVCSRLLTVCWHFHTYINGKTILETRGDRVIMGLCQIGPRYLSFFSILFYQFYGWVLYTSVTYKHMYTVVYFTMLILFSVVFCIFYKAILLPFIFSV